MSVNTNLNVILEKNKDKIIAIVNSKANVEFVNTNFVKAFKLSCKTEIINQNIFTFGSIYNKFQIIKIWKIISEGLIWKGEIKTSRKNKEELYMLASIIPYKQNKYVVIAEDITIQKQTEIQIREAENKKNIIISALPDTLIVINKKGLISQYKKENNNEILEDNNIIGKNILEVNMPPDLAAKMYNASKFTLKAKKIKQFNYYYKSNEKHIECRIIPLNEDEILCIIRDITKRVIAEKILKNREKSYKSMVENFPSGLIIQKNNRLYYANKLALRFLGCKNLNELKKYNIFELLPEEFRNTSKERVKSALEGKNVPFMEFPIKKINTNKYFLFETKPVLFDYYGEKVCQIVMRDLRPQKKLIKETLRAEMAEKINKDLQKEMLIRKKAEENLKNLLNEKEELIKEIHHRVKNNMQVMTSILNLQSNMINDEKMKKIFEESQNRIKSMALVHENIYSNKSLTKMDFEKYVKSLSDNLIRTYELVKKNVEIKLNIENFYLPVTLAVPCGLIINEILSYSINNFFVEISKNIIIFVEAKLDNNEVKIFISDNGTKINDNKLLSNPKTLGFQLVSALIEQLNGKISLDTKKQNKFSIFFNI